MSHVLEQQHLAPMPRHSAGHRFGSFLAWLRSAAPTLLIVGALCGLAYWGHSSDWTIPKFSALIGGAEADEDDWCPEHNVPESECIECKPELLAPLKDYGWCKEHGIAQCPLHHPSIAQLSEPPTITQEDFERAARALRTLPRAENNSRCKLHTKRIQFESREAVTKAGVDIAVAYQHAITEAITATGEIAYDNTKTAHLASRVAGTLTRVSRQVGDQVKRGDILALVDAAEVGRAKADYLQGITQLRLATSNRDRLRPLASNGTVPGKQIRDADAAFDEAKIRLLSAQQSLQNLGLPIDYDQVKDRSIEELQAEIRFLGLQDEAAELDAADTKTSNLFPIRAPLDGVIVERNAAVGEVVDDKAVLFAVANVSRMWLLMNVRQEDVSHIRVGQKVLFATSAQATRDEVEGTVSWLSTAVDEKSRTVKVRVELDNATGQLRANTFGTARVVLREDPKAIVIPTEAIHFDGCCQIVFVRDKNYMQDDSPKFFHVRKVRVGAKQDGLAEIIVGLLPGEIVASKGSVVLESQLLKANLGAGCACGHD